MSYINLSEEKGGIMTIDYKKMSQEYFREADRIEKLMKDKREKARKDKNYAELLNVSALDDIRVEMICMGKEMYKRTG